MPETSVRLTREPIDVPGLVAALRRDDAGAIATFEGTVRAERAGSGRTLVALDYSAYEEMAVDQMRALRERALSQFDILDAAVVHRLGRMALGETSIAIVVAASHRAAAFDACRWLIDTVKVDVPIWKAEVWSDGSRSWSDPLP